MLSQQFLPSDPGASFGKQAATPDTSSIFIGSSKDKATAWRINRGGDNTPNAAYAGKGAISFGDDSPYQPVAVK